MPPPPGHKYVAIAFVRNCGATTAFSTQVAIVAAGMSPPDRGNDFVAQAGSAPQTAGGSLPIDLRWAGPQRLEVTYAAGAEEFLRVDRLGGISIDYRVVAATGLPGAKPSPVPDT
jgi:hypothetical protein